MTRISADMSGFTLLEILVALVVLSFVVMGLAQGLRFGLTAWDHQAAIMNRDGALDATDRTLRTLIADMAPGEDARNPSILGTRDRVSFTTTLPENVPAERSRLADVALGVDAAHHLVMRWRPHLHARILAPLQVRTTSLLAGVSGLTLSYYRRAAAGQPGGWVSEWQSADPPGLIRLHIGFSDRGLHWPDIIVAPARGRDIEQ